MYFGNLHLMSEDKECDGKPRHFGLGTLDNPCDRYHFWSLHPGGGNWLFADASARYIPYSADEILGALATRAGGETIRLPD
jgi:prepilin-type processing-associated H-X9-DG protein